VPGRSKSDEPGRRRAHSGVRWAVGLVLAGQAAGVQAQVQSLDREQTERERLRRQMEARPQGYVDKVLDSSPPEEAPAATDAPPADTGNTRSWFAETRMGTGRSDDRLALRMATELGQRVGYRYQTTNYGELIFEADARSAHGDLGIGTSSLGLTSRRTSARFVARNIGFPLSPSTFADTSLGDVSSEITNALGRSYRLSLGSTTVRGTSLRVAGPRFDLRAGTGERGRLTGGPVPGFESSGGRLSWLGYSHRLGPNTTAGVQVGHAADISGGSALFPLAGLATDDVTSVAAGATHVLNFADGDWLRGRVIAVGSRATGAGIASSGNAEYIEGTYSGRTQRHEFGAYRSDPEVRFGDAIVSSGGHGAYWRVDVSGPRLNWGVGADFEDSSAGNFQNRRLGVSGNAAWRIDRHRYLQGSFNVTQTHTENPLAGLLSRRRGMYLSTAYRTRLSPTFGPTYFRLTLRRNEVLVSDDVPATGETAEWEQDWITGQYETLRPELRTTLGLARERAGSDRQFSPTAGVVFRYWLDPDWHVGGSLRYTAQDTNLSTSRGLSGTLDTERSWPSSGWRLGASLQLNQAVVRLAPGGLAPPETSRSDDKYLSVYLRWEGQAGTTPRGIGAREGSAGSGGIDGLVFFDRNRDGEQQADENGVPDVEVFLDGRYRVRTDRNGRFSYPLVGTGQHVLTMVPESVPLPWGPAAGDGVKVDVPLRGQVLPKLPVIRVGD
jgi:hypothetical protein